MQEQQRALGNPEATAAVHGHTEKDMLAERHRREREAFLASGKAQFREARQAAYRAVRDEFKPHWREHFRHDRDLRERFVSRAAVANREAVRLAREGDHDAAAERLALASMGCGATPRLAGGIVGACAGTRLGGRALEDRPEQGPTCCTSALRPPRLAP